MSDPTIFKRRGGNNTFSSWNHCRTSRGSLVLLGLVLVHLCFFSVSEANKKYRDSLLGLGTMPLATSHTPVGISSLPAAAAIPVAPAVSVAAPVASSPIVAASAPVVAPSTPMVAASIPAVAASAPVVAASAPVVAASAPVVAASSPMMGASTPVVASHAAVSSIPVATAPSVMGSMASPLASSVMAPTGTTRTVREEYSSTGGIASPFVGRRLTKLSSTSHSGTRATESRSDVSHPSSKPPQQEDHKKMRGSSQSPPTAPSDAPKRDLHGFYPGYNFGDLGVLTNGFIVARGEIFQENPCVQNLPCPQPPIPDVSSTTSTAVVPTSTTPIPMPNTTSTSTTIITPITPSTTTTTTTTTQQNVTMLALAVKAPGDVNAQDLQTAALKGMLNKLNGGDSPAAVSGTSESAGFSVSGAGAGQPNFAAYSLPTIQGESSGTISTSSSTLRPSNSFFPIRLPQDGDYTFYTLLFKPNDNQHSVVEAQVKGTADGSVTIQLPTTVFKTSPFTLLEGSEQTTVTNDKQKLARLLPIQQGQQIALFFKLPDETRVAFVDQRYLTLPGTVEGQTITLPYEKKQSGLAGNLSEFFASLLSKAKLSSKFHVQPV